MPESLLVSKQSYALGCFELALSQVAIGINLVTAKFLLNHHVPFILFMQIRFLLGTIFIGFFVKWQKQSFVYNQNGNHFSRKDAWVLICQAACGGFVFNILMMIGLQYCSASVASITFSAFPAVLALLSWLILKDILSLAKIYSIALAVFGVILINLGKNEQHIIVNGHTWGMLLILLSMLPEAIFVILGKWHDCQLSPYVMTFWVNLVNAVLFLPITFMTIHPSELSSLTLQESGWILAYAFSGGVLFFIFWYRGISRVTATSAALITTIGPLSTCLLAWLILGEKINLMEIFGMTCILVSIVFGSGWLSSNFSTLKET